MKNIVVEGCQLSLSVGTGTVTITSVPSQKVKADGHGVYKGSLSFTVSGYTGGDITVPGSGAGGGSISGSATKVKVESQPVLLEGDSVTVTLNGLKPAGMSTAPASQDVEVKIQSAGQTKAKGV